MQSLENTNILYANFTTTVDAAVMKKHQEPFERLSLKNNNILYATFRTNVDAAMLWKSIMNHLRGY